MLIIDSLLIINFFLSGEVQENLSLFCFHQAAHKAPISGANATGHNLEPS
jgi:hypothetical protein